MQRLSIKPKHPGRNYAQVTVSRVKAHKPAIESAYAEVAREVMAGENEPDANMEREAADVLLWSRIGSVLILATALGLAGLYAAMWAALSQ